MHIIKPFLVFLLFFPIVGFLSGTDYVFKLPVKSTAIVTEEKGILQIECSFAPTRLFTQAVNVKINAKHAKKICYSAIKRYRNIKEDLSVSGLYRLKQTKYEDNKVTFYYAVPVSGIREVKHLPSEKTEAAQPASGQDRVVTKKAELKTNKVEKENKGPGKSLFDASELEKFELAGYSIRYKNDIMQYVAMQMDAYKETKKAADYECLKKYSEIIADMEIQKKKAAENIGKDYRMVQTEKNKILDEYNIEVKKLQEEIRQDGIKLKAQLKNELEQLKQSEKKELDAEKDSVRRSEIEKDINDIEQSIQDIDHIVLQ